MSALLILLLAIGGKEADASSGLFDSGLSRPLLVSVMLHLVNGDEQAYSVMNLLLCVTAVLLSVRCER